MMFHVFSPRFQFSFSHAIGGLLTIFALLSTCPAIHASDVKDRVIDHLEKAIAFERQGDPDQAELYLDSAYMMAMKHGNVIGQAQVSSRRGILWQTRGYYDKALKEHFNALALLEDERSPILLSDVLNNIGTIHHYQKNFEEAERYYDRALTIRKTVGDQHSLALSYNNYGSLCEDRGDLEKALEHHAKSLGIWTTMTDTNWIAISYANIAFCLKSSGQLDSALTLYTKALQVYGSRPLSYSYGQIMMRIGEIHLEKNDPQEALYWCQRAYNSSIVQQATPLSENSCYCLYRAHNMLGDDRRALELYKQYVGFKDSLSGQELTREITMLEMDYQFQRQSLADSLEAVEARMKAQYEFDSLIGKEKQKRIVFMLMGLCVLVLSGGLWNRLRFLRRSKEQIRIERDKSEKLLLNILPAPVALELKLTGSSKARQYEMVTVLFSDFVNFTGLAETMSAHELVDELNACFQAFDRIMAEHHLEKIKTIGDAYMAVGGLHDAERGTPEEVIRAALDLQEFIEERKSIRESAGLKGYRMRVGIHSGPVVAGIVGHTKFQYDIWGDTVNIAARMENYGEIGTVNISRSTYDLIKDEKGFQFRSRGAIGVKGKGMMEMFYVTSDEIYMPYDFDLNKRSLPARILKGETRSKRTGLHKGTRAYQ